MLFRMHITNVQHLSMGSQNYVIMIIGPITSKKQTNEKQRGIEP